MADFTLHGYAKILDEFSERGYSSRTFHDVKPNSAHLVLRHDIDYCINYAIPLAELEAKMGMCASYYVLLGGEFYNPASKAAKHTLRHLSELGHEVGLHFDASLYNQDLDSLNKACERECEELEFLLGMAVESVSFHRPAEALLGMDLPIGGRIHTYQRRFFSEIGYCADSQGRFRYGHPLKHEKVSRKEALQLVTHPVWWFADYAEDPVSRIKSFLKGRAKILSDEMARNSIPFKQYLESGEA